MDSLVQLPIIRRFIVAGSILLGLWLGWTVAHGEFLVPGLIAAVLIPLIASYLIGIAPDAIAAGLLLLGYLVGNRGFAQLNIPGVPLLPGEAVLALGLGIAAWRIVWDKTLFIRRDSLNLMLLLWIVICAIRLPIDLSAHGLMALRDFALVYYALFFYLAQGWGRMPEGRRFLEICLAVGFALTAPVATLFEKWPHVVTQMSIAGVPLILVKGDVAGAFMAAGIFWFASRYARSGNRWQLALAAVCVAGVLLSNSRAALVSALLGGACLLLLRERRITRALLAVTALGAFALLVEAALPKSPGRSSRAFRIYESMRTVLDISGTHTPISVDLGDKPDNNRFRLVWWEAVIGQARAEAPVLGLGFGRDLADEFVRRYYPESLDDFNARSPHNFLITLFARTGTVGWLLFVGVLGAMAVRTRRAAQRDPDTGAGAAWLVPWMIFCAACFGVVLEGPMGAIVFWTTLGLLNAAESAPDYESAHTNAAALHARAGSIPRELTSPP